MSLLDCIVVAQIVLAGLALVLARFDANLRWIYALLLFTFFVFLPWNYAADFMAGNWGGCYWIAAVVVNYLSYRIFKLRIYYAGQLCRCFSALWHFNVVSWVLPVSYDVRVYAQESMLAKVALWTAYLHLFTLMQYPISHFLKQPSGVVSGFMRSVYDVFFDNIYFVYDLYYPLFLVLQGVQVFILFSLVWQSSLGLINKRFVA